MKKLLYLMIASALLAFGGCTKEPAENENGNNKVETPEMPDEVPDKPAETPDNETVEIAMKTVSLNASMAKTSDSSANIALMSVVNDNGEFSWTTDDAIAVNVVYIDENGDETSRFYEFTAKEISSENDNVATFEGEIPENGIISGVAVYPYDDKHTFIDGNLTVNFPDEVYEVNHLPMMYANIEEGENIQFQHLSSMVKVTYRCVPNGTDRFELTSDAVAGLYEVDLETGELEATDEVTDQVSVRFAALSTFYAEKSVFVPVPAGEREISVKLYKGENVVKWSELSSRGSRDYVAGYINKLPAIDVHFTDLYVIGDAVSMGGWAQSQAVLMEETEDHVFTWTGEVAAGQVFRFPLLKAWWPAIYDNRDGTGEIVFTDPAKPADEPKPKRNDFSVPKDGIYTITVNTVDMDNVTVDIRLDEEIKVYQPIYVVGDATKWGYSIKPATEQWMTEESRGVFVWEGHLSAINWSNGKASRAKFKFFVTNDYAPVYVMDPESGDDWTLKRFDSYPSNDQDKQFTVEKSGKYRLTADLKTMKLTAELIEESFETYQKLYAIGDALAAGWTLGKAEELVYKGMGVYTWTGNMTVDKEFKFLLQNNAWGPHYGPNKNTGGTYEMDGTTALHTSGDFKYKLPSSSYQSGVYTITLDVLKGTISVTPQE